ncbi:unnamed protein product, partial [Iphiclides podalirius]
MLILYHIVASAVALGCVCSINIASNWPHRRRNAEDERMIFGFRRAYDGRRLDQGELMRKLLYDSLKKDRSVFKSRLWLRQHKEKPTEAPRPTSPPTKDSMANVVEKELKFAMGMKSSALLDKPYVMKTGDKEFLVLHPGAADPFVTVIPNDIYYNVEKTCVNWLEDCSAQGVRSRLLERIRSPYM